MSISTSKLIEGALTLTAALAWNEAAKAIVDKVAPMSIITSNMEKDTAAKIIKDNKTRKMIGTIIYAILITIFIVIVFSVYKYSAQKINETSLSNITPLI